MKICKCCNKEFNRKHARNFCSKECYSKNNSTRLRNKRKEYRGATVHLYLNYLLKYHKRREHLNLDFLVELWNKQKGLCALSGVPMTHLLGQGKVHTNISIDRINSTIGYEPSNIQLVCVHANKMKMNLSHEELSWWCEQILKKGTH